MGALGKDAASTAVEVGCADEPEAGADTADSELDGVDERTGVRATFPPPAGVPIIRQTRPGSGSLIAVPTTQKVTGMPVPPALSAVDRVTSVVRAGSTKVAPACPPPVDRLLVVGTPPAPPVLPPPPPPPAPFARWASLRASAPAAPSGEPEGTGPSGHNPLGVLLGDRPGQASTQAMVDGGGIGLFEPDGQGDATFQVQVSK